MTQLVIRTPKPVSFPAALAPQHIPRAFWTYRDLIRQWTIRQFTQAYRDTHLGLLWNVIQPLLTLTVYTFVFSIILRTGWDHPSFTDIPAPLQFAVTFFVGQALYTFFSEVTNQSPNLLLSRRNLVRKVVFPLQVLPFIISGSALLYKAISLTLILIAAAIITKGHISSTIYFFPLVLIPLICLTLGISWFLASLGTYIKDTRAVVLVLTQMLFFLTPVFYPIDRVPERFRFILELNPLTHIVTDARRTLLWSEQPHWPTYLLVTLISLLVMQLGYAWFMRTKGGFADAL